MLKAQCADSQHSLAESYRGGHGDWDWRSGYNSGGVGIRPDQLHAARWAAGRHSSSMHDMLAGLCQACRCPSALMGLGVRVGVSVFSTRLPLPPVLQSHPLPCGYSALPFSSASRHRAPA